MRIPNEGMRVPNEATESLPEFIEKFAAVLILAGFPRCQRASSSRCSSLTPGG